MIRNYESPELELMHMLSADIVTLSVGASSESGDINGGTGANDEPTEAWRYN